MRNSRYKKDLLTPFVLKSRNKSPMKSCSLYREGRSHSYYQRQGNQGQESWINKACYFFTNLLPQAQNPLSCRFFTNLWFLCPNGIKASCYDHFFESNIFMGSLYIRNQICFSAINVNLIIIPAKKHRREEGKVFHPYICLSSGFIND